jgi:hypothetical protein
MLQVPTGCAFLEYGCKSERQNDVQCLLAVTQPLCTGDANMHCVRRLQLTLLLAVSLALPISSLAQAPTGNTLTNADIVRMVKAGIPEDIIVREIQMSETNFVTNPNALIELKKQHVPDRVLGAILNSRGGTGRPQAEALTAPMVYVQAAGPHPHHLPTFDAAVRLDSKSTAKVSVGDNQIKVERSGVPLFSLKWKDQRSR